MEASDGLRHESFFLLRGNCIEMGEKIHVTEGKREEGGDEGNGEIRHHYLYDLPCKG